MVATEVSSQEINNIHPTAASEAEATEVSQADTSQTEHIQHDPTKPETGKTDTTSTPEASKPERIVSAQTQQKEHEMVYANILQRRMDAAKAKEDRILATKNNPDQETAGTETLSAGENALSTMRWILTEAPQKVDYTSATNPIGKMFEGKPVTLMIKGELVTVIGISQIDGNTMHCMCYPGAGTSIETRQVPREITRHELYKAVYNSEKSAILDTMSDAPEERRLFEMIDNPPADPTEKNKIIEAAAESTGLFTASDLQEYIENRKFQEGTRLTPDEKEELDEIAKLLTDVNVVDQKLMTQIIDMGIGKRITKLEERLKELQKYPEKQEEIRRTQEELTLLKTLTSGEKSPLQAYFAGIETGTIDQVEAKKLIDVLKSGDKKAFLTTLIENVQRNQHLSDEDKNNLIGQINSINFNTEGNSLALTLLLGMLVLSKTLVLPVVGTALKK